MIMSIPCARWPLRDLAKMTAAFLFFAACAGEQPGSAAAGPTQVAVRIAIAGEGGLVRSTDPAFECRAASCTQQIVRGSPLHLVAVPDARATFQGWGGACSGSGACEVLADRDLDVKATFSAPPTGLLSVAVQVEGEGEIRSTPAGIDCGPTCSATFASGVVVSLLPSPHPGFLFAGWSGACTGMGACRPGPADAANLSATVHAVFNRLPPDRHGLTVAVAGNGTVRSVPEGIDCGSSCSASFASGASVELTALAGAGARFAGWAGACTGTGGCTLTLSADAQVSAAFEAVAPARAALNVVATGSGRGHVGSVEPGIDCRSEPSAGPRCSATFPLGATVHLVAAADAGSLFAGWSGACTGTAGCAVTLDRELTVSAGFDKAPLPPATALLTVRRRGSGSGSVDSRPAGISCGDSCSATFAAGTLVTVSQTTAAGSRFTGWSGACSGAGACTVTLAAPAEVTAEFVAIPPARVSIEITHSDPSHNLLAVAPDGTAYGTSNATSGAEVYASTDNARTWVRRGRASARVVRMTALSDGVLLADVESGGIASIERSADGGASWVGVLALGRSRTLSPHSFDEANGAVYLAEYQVVVEVAPVRLWSSADRGRTWTVLHTFSGYKHAHAVRVDPDGGAIWVFMGDKGQSALLRSRDGGSTWERVLTGEAQARVVDAVFTPAGLLYGLDVSPPLLSGILRLAPNGAVTRLANLPGPSYSIHAMRAGGFLAGTTREPLDVYPPPGEENTYIFGSADGETWNELARFPRIDRDEYANADVNWELRSGEAVIHLFNVEPMWSGEGYMLATVKASP